MSTNINININIYPVIKNNFFTNFYKTGKKLHDDVTKLLDHSKEYAKSILESTKPSVLNKNASRKWKIISRFTLAFARIYSQTGPTYISGGRRGNLHRATRGSDRTNNNNAQLGLFVLGVLAGLWAVISIAETDKKLERTRLASRNIVNRSYEITEENDTVKNAVQWVALTHIKMLDREHESAKAQRSKFVTLLGASTLMAVGAVFSSLILIQISAVAMTILGIKTVYDAIKDTTARDNRNDAIWLKETIKLIKEERAEEKTKAPFAEAPNWNANDYMHQRPPAFNPESGN